MIRTLPWLAAMSLVLVGGVVHGIRTDRWSIHEVRRRMAERTSQLPHHLGEWIGEDLPVVDRHQRVADADIIVARSYHKPLPNGERFHVVLVLFSGRPQPMSVHTPDFCFPGSGYRMDGPAQVYIPEIEGRRQYSFWFARFFERDGTARRVYWTWGDGKSWRASDDPRGEFAHHRALYKLYLVGAMPRIIQGEEIDEVRVFLNDVFPVMHRRLAIP